MNIIINILYIVIVFLLLCFFGFAQSKANFYEKWYKSLFDLISADYVKKYCDDQYGKGRSVERIAIYQFCIDVLEKSKIDCKGSKNETIN